MGSAGTCETHSICDKFLQPSSERFRRHLAMQSQSAVLRKRFRQSERIQLNVCIPMSELREYRRDDVPGTKGLLINCPRRKGRDGLLPNLSFIFDLVAQIKNQLPVFPGEVLIRRFS